MKDNSIYQQRNYYYYC